MIENKLYQQYFEQNTDNYFLKTQAIVRNFGDVEVVYAVFLRSQALFAPEYLKRTLTLHQEVYGVKVELIPNAAEGDEVPEGQPLMFLKGSFASLCILETLVLQAIGYPSVAAYSALQMSLSCPKVQFIAMGARHYPNPETTNMVDYGISLGSKEAQKLGAVGFIGSSVNATSSFFGNQSGLGTMPHALVGYAGSTLKAAQMYREVFPEGKLVVLVDFFGREVTDGLEVCQHFKELAEAGELMLRLDTSGERFAEGLTESASKAIINRYVTLEVQESLSATEKKYLTGKGVSAASIFHIREVLDQHGFNKVKLVVSSGFNLTKVRLMSKIKAPVDVIGTGSVLTGEFCAPIATADIISYDGKSLVKKGREHLIESWNKLK